MPKTRTVRKMAGPFIGVRAQPQPTSGDLRYLDRSINCYPTDTDVGPLVVGRPGFALMDDTIGSPGVGQAGGQFTKVAGTQYTFAIVDGEIATYNWGTPGWTTVVTQANITTATGALATSGTIYTLTFADGLVISDGTNPALWWDGSSGAGGITVLPQTFYGQPWVYYGKLMGIDSSDHTLFVWSEEGDPTLGYVVSPYNNGWNLIQTDPNALTAGIGLNEVMYLFRKNSITAVSGSVGPDFATTGQREAVSEDVGCMSPLGMCVKDGVVYFLGTNRRHYRIRPGGLLEEVGRGGRPAYATIPMSTLDDAVLIPCPGTDLVVSFCVGPAQTALSVGFAIDTQSSEYAGQWLGWLATVITMVLDGSGVEQWMHLGGTDADHSIGGYPYVHGRPDGSTWVDGFNAADAAIVHSVRTEPIGYDLAFETDWDRIDGALVPATTVTNLNVSYVTPRKVGGGQVVGTVLGGGALLDFFVLDTDTLGGAPTGDSHFAVGIEAPGRFIAPELSHSTAFERFQLATIAVTGTVQDDQPEYI